MTPVCQQPCCRWQATRQGCGSGMVTDWPGGHEEPDGSPVLVGNSGTILNFVL